MVDVNISTLDVVVSGGPSTVKVDADFGPQGQRGSFILYGAGKPENAADQLTYSPQILDWYINLDPADEEYLYIYQYITVAGGQVWKPFIKIFPNIFNTNETVTFVDGLAELNLSVSNITLPYINALLPLESQLTQLFNLHVNIPSLNPIAASIYLGSDPDSPTGSPAIVNEMYVLPIKIRAAEFDGTSWSNLDGDKIAHISINMI